MIALQRDQKKKEKNSTSTGILTWPPVCFESIANLEHVRAERAQSEELHKGESKRRETKKSRKNRKKKIRINERDGRSEGRF